jgi:hypothetical protein
MISSDEVLAEKNFECNESDTDDKTSATTNFVFHPS